MLPESEARYNRPPRLASLGGKIVRVTLLPAVLGLIGLVVAALLLIKPFMLKTAHEKAREHGFELEIGDLDWGIGWLELRSSRFSLIGVRGMHGTVERIHIGLPSCRRSET